MLLPLVKATSDDPPTNCAVTKWTAPSICLLCTALYVALAPVAQRRCGRSQRRLPMTYMLFVPTDARDHDWLMFVR